MNIIECTLYFIKSISNLVKWIYAKIVGILDYTKSLFGKKSTQCVLVFSGIAILIPVIILAIAKTVQDWDDAPDRGALVITKAMFGDGFDKVFPGKNYPQYMNWQGWDPEDSMWYYTTTQGSDLIPYDFFMVLEQENATALFRSTENIDRYRYIPLRPTYHNPDGLPLGMVKDTYAGKDYMGFTCSACHTNQINYKRTAIRVDGAPSLADMENFIIDMSKSLKATLKDKDKKKRFIDAVMARNGFKEMLTASRNYSSEKEVEVDLIKFSSRVEDYVFINHSRLKDGRDLTYGYGRLDAFGRIFNRALQHILNKKQITMILADVIAAPELDAILKDVNDSVLTDNEFDHVLERIKPLLTAKQMIDLNDRIFNSPNGPVSYPFLWDTPQHDYVQWNGIAANAGLGPLGRNAGEVIGVFGTLDWEEEEGFSLLAYLLGQKNTQRHISYNSSVDMANLERLEDHLKKLYSPVWPEVVLPKIDNKRAARGGVLFEKKCVACHASIDRTDPKRKVIANFSRVKDVGTDPTTAANVLAYEGYSGITEGQYLNVGIGNLLMEEKMPVAALLTLVTKNVVATPDAEKPFFRRWEIFIMSLVDTLLNNDIEASLKRGDYDPDTTINPFASLMAYKARPLNGIWATAPYLHNGSVPTLYDLLLPKKNPGDPAGEYRPDVFYIGSREFDPVKVGFISEKGKGSRFDTSLPGNHNTGHDGDVKILTKAQRLDLVEYMKTL